MHVPHTLKAHHHRIRGFTDMGHRAGRVAALPAVLLCLLVLPASVASAVPLLMIVAWLAGLPLWTVAAGAFLLSLVVLLPPVRSALAGRVVKARPPSLTQGAQLDRPWAAATTASGVAPDRFHLRVSQVPRICLPPVGARTVVITTTALERATPDQLTALLVHEIGHHRGRYAVAPALLVWLTLPVLVVAWIGARSAAVTRPLDRGLARLRRAGRPASTGSLLSGVRTAFYWTALVTIGLLWAAGHAVRISCTALTLLCGLLATPLTRAAEHEADGVATRLGFGAGLRDLLDSQSPVGEPGLVRIWGEPPPLPARARRLSSP